MRHLLLFLVSVALFAGIACGGSDEPEPADPTIGIATSTPSAAATEAPPQGSALDSVFPLLFSGALGGASGLDFERGDEALKELLLRQGDLPAGYSVVEEMVVRVPDGISQTGRADLAFSMAGRGDLDAEDPTAWALLMSLVGRFDDLQDLDALFAESGALSEEALKDMIGVGAEIPGLELVNVESLDVPALGGGAFGLQITLNLTNLFDIFGEIPEEHRAAAEAFREVTVRMYLFGRGNLMGGLARLGFGGSLNDGVDELALALVLAEKMEAAQ